MLFESKVRGIKLLEFLNWAHQSFNRAENQQLENGVLALPAIQRDSAWNPKQVLDLWDTVFRGLPLGAFMLQERSDGQQGHRAGADARNEAQPEGWDLLDGQQRLRSLLLGRYGINLEQGARDARCIWIRFENRNNEKSYKLFLSSASQPFGYKDDGYKPGTTERNTARARYEPDGMKITFHDHRAYNHELFENFITRGGLILTSDDNATQPTPMPPERHPQNWPPLPYGDSLDLVQGQTPYSILPLHLLLRVCFDSPPEQQLQNIQELIGIEYTPLAIGMIKAVYNSEIALINASLDNNIDNLRLLFDRIGAGGTPLSTEDRLFSLYKSIRPNFHNLVLELSQNVGSVMPPTKIAVTAIRISNARSHQQRGEQSEKGNNTPDIAAFSRAIGENQNNLIQVLDEICLGQNAAFTQAFISTSNAIKYNDNNPLGLPASVMRYLPPQLMQTLIFWKIQSGQNFNHDCNSAARFCLGWLLRSRHDDKASNHCFRIIRENEKPTLHQIFSSLSDVEEFTRPIMSPDNMREVLLSPKNGPMWPSIEHRIRNQSPLSAELVKLWWNDDRRFLPWLQRAYLAAAFADYDPLADREDDTPYDVDHMIPQSDWGFYWGYRNERLDPIERFAPSDLNNRLRWSRSDIGNAIGNKWLVESSTNRGWGDESFPDKLAEILPQAERGETPYNLLLKGAFDLDAQEQWNTASNGNIWSDNRMIAFQVAVENRSVWLYTRFYNESGLAQWLGNVPNG